MSLAHDVSPAANSTYMGAVKAIPGEPAEFSKPSLSFCYERRGDKNLYRYFFLICIAV